MTVGLFQYPTGDVFDYTAFYKTAMQELEARYRFNQQENLLTSLTDLEKSCAIWDALEDINSIGPQTAFTFAAVTDPDGDPRWIRWLWVGTARNALRTLITDWVQNGFSVRFAEYEVEDRLQRYKDLHDLLDKTFQDGVEKLKKTSQKFLLGVAGGGFSNPLIRYRARIFSAGQAYRYSLR